MKHKHHDTGSERSQKIVPHHCSASAKGIAQLDEPEAALVYSLLGGTPSSPKDTNEFIGPEIDDYIERLL